MEVDMNHVESRLKTFDFWPIEEENPACICTANTMAESGFFKCGGEDDMDLTRCFCCLKEMEGWEADDNPREARYHTKKCVFVKLGKPASSVTNAEMLRVVNHQQVEKLRANAEEWMVKFEEEAADTRQALAALAKKPKQRRN